MGSSCRGGAYRPAPTWMLVVAFTIVVLLALVLAYRYGVAYEARGGSGGGDERFQGGAAPPQQQVVFLYMTGCHWCDDFKPEWDKFSADRALARMNVVAVAYERADPQAAEFAGYVEGYPTVLFVTADGSIVRYSGKRTSEALMNFVKKQQQQQSGR